MNMTVRPAGSKEISPVAQMEQIAINPSLPKENKRQTALRIEKAGLRSKDALARRAAKRGISLEELKQRSSDVSRGTPAPNDSLNTRSLVAVRPIGLGKYGSGNSFGDIGKVNGKREGKGKEGKGRGKGNGKGHGQSGGSKFGLKPAVAVGSWKPRTGDTWGQNDPESLQKNADLRRMFLDDRDSLTPEDKARAELLIERSQRKQEKRKRLKEKIKSSRKKIKKSSSVVVLKREAPIAINEKVTADDTDGSDSSDSGSGSD
jgi:hypothetical protein